VSWLPFLCWARLPESDLVRRKDDVDETLIGKAIVDDQTTSAIMIDVCEKHIRSIDTELADQFSMYAETLGSA
jgi:hypothetical protein